MDELHVDRAGPRATVTIDRPRTKNALTASMWGELRDVFRDLGADADVRVVVVTGAGGEFCSGADLSEASPLSDRRGLASMSVVNEAAMAQHELAVPTIAKVDGVAVGAGASLALGCDLVVASDRARFGLLFARRALSLDFGASWSLPRLVGLHKAKELALLGDIIPAEEAARMGLVNKVVPVADLDGAVDDWARRLAAGPPVALAASKELLQRSLDRSFAEALLAEAKSQALNFSTVDAAEAAAAWLDRREPRFEGR